MLVGANTKFSQSQENLDTQKSSLGIGLCEKHDILLNYVTSFQTRDLTAMDYWFLLCIGFVALALFEFALLLRIRFGKSSKVNGNQKEDNFEKIAEAKCYKIDRHAMRVFIAVHGVLVSIYFFVVYNRWNQH